MISRLPRCYFNLNIRHSEESWRAKVFLGCDSRPRAPIFYGERTIEQLRSTNSDPQKVDKLRSKQRGEAKEFLELYEDSQEKGFQPVMVTIDDGRVWIYEPIGKPSECELIDGFRDKKHNDQSGNKPKIQKW
jgi:hypothetical protein